MSEPALPAGFARIAGAGVVCLLLVPRPLSAQVLATDTTRVTYRTRDVVFVVAGRARGVAVGDTLAVLRNDTTILVRAVVLSLAERSASARLLDPDSPVAVGACVRFQPHPVEVAPALPADTLPTDAAAVPANVAPAPAARRADLAVTPPVAVQDRGGRHQRHERDDSDGDERLDRHAGR